jgi:hypothetical protein
LKKNEVQAMTEITFYRQQRRDGSIRSGLHATGPFDLENFELGPELLADDPYANVLDWFIDLQLESPADLNHAEAARDELLACKSSIRSGLNLMIQELGVGVDRGMSLTWQNFPGLPDGYSCRLNLSISSRIRGNSYIELLQDFMEHWPDYCRSLRVLVEQR